MTAFDCDEPLTFGFAELPENRVWCDKCGIPVPAQDALSAIADESTNAARVMHGCTRTHLEEALSVDWPLERSWAVRISSVSRVVRLRGLTEAQEATAMDLSVEQLRRAYAWRNQWVNDQLPQFWPPGGDTAVGGPTWHLRPRDGQ
jgi:hypothetical protein